MLDAALEVSKSGVAAIAIEVLMVVLFEEKGFENVLEFR